MYGFVSEAFCATPMKTFFVFVTAAADPLRRDAPLED